MTAKKEDDNRVLLEKLVILLEERDTFDSNFLKGIAEGEVFENIERISIPNSVPKGLDKIRYKWEIIINPDSYLGRAENIYFNDYHFNDFDEITEQLNMITNRNIISVVVKPKINDDTFLSVMGEVIRSRKTGDQFFNSKFIDGFSEGKWDLLPEKKPKLPQPGKMQHNQTTSTVIKNKLIIKLPVENFQDKKEDFHKDDDDYLLRIAREIKHFPDEIDTIQVKSL